MYPELIRIGGLVVHSYGLMISLAILLSAFLLYREAPRENINPDHVLEAIIVASFFGLLGSRILYMALNWHLYSDRLFSAFFTQFEGLTFYGAFFGGVIALYVWSVKRRVNFLKFTDLLAPYLALGYALGRIGCFLNGCCYGIQSNVPWALPISVGDPVLRHPVQLYAALSGLAIFFILKALRPRRPFIGFLLIALFALYGLQRFIVEFFRYSEAVWIGLSTAQIFSLGLIIASLSAVAVYYFVLPGKDRLTIKLPRWKKKRKRGKRRKKR
jgi:phosphatidylglycerol:prolipoprotein diacylglycerol transferase